MDNFDRRFAEASRQMDRHQKTVSFLSKLIFVIVIASFLAVVGGGMLLILNPEVIGNFFGKIVEGFNNA